MKCIQMKDNILTIKLLSYFCTGFSTQLSRRYETNGMKVLIELCIAIQSFIQTTCSNKSYDIF